MKILSKIALTLLVVVLGYVFLSWLAFGGKSSYRRFFGTPPSCSPAIKEHWGYNGLAGSSEFIMFAVDTNEMNRVIAAKGLKPVLLRDPRASEFGKDCTLPNQLLDADIMIAKRKGLVPAFGYIASKYQGGIYYVLLVDESGSNALFHYSKL